MNQNDKQLSNKTSYMEGDDIALQPVYGVRDDLTPPVFQGLNSNYFYNFSAQNSYYQDPSLNENGYSGLMGSNNSGNRGYRNFRTQKNKFYQDEFEEPELLPEILPLLKDIKVNNTQIIDGNKQIPPATTSNLQNEYFVNAPDKFILPQPCNYTFPTAKTYPILANEKFINTTGYTNNILNTNIGPPKNTDINQAPKLITKESDHVKKEAESILNSPSFKKQDDQEISNGAGNLSLQPKLSENSSLVLPLQVCNCKKSKCLKLYCECFSNGRYCHPSCSCVGCHNTAKHDDLRNLIIAEVSEKNPNAFRSKFKKNKKTEKKHEHVRGCNCKKSNCLKKYCECYQAGIMCSDNCHCVECKNCTEDKKEHKDEAENKNSEEKLLKKREKKKKKDLYETPFFKKYELLKSLAESKSQLEKGELKDKSS